MAGGPKSEKLLNNTLLFIIKLLNKNNIKNWFVAYGTLLGIVRNNSCIDGDNDIDIIIHEKYYHILKKLLIENNFTIDYRYDINNKITMSRCMVSSCIIKTKDSEDLSTIDFYMARIQEDGSFYDLWEKVNWSKCYNEKKELIEYNWNGNILYLPFNYENKLSRRYGETWRIPDSKNPGNRNISIL
jgi:hypothetical protein